MMNFTCNVVRQPFHVAVFTFDDVLKDTTRIKMEMWIFSPRMLTVQLFRGSVT